VTAFAERDLGIIHAAAAASNRGEVLCVTDGATSGHQLVHQFLAELLRDAGSDVRHWRPSGDEGGLQRIGVAHSHGNRFTRALTSFKYAVAPPMHGGAAFHFALKDRVA